MTSTQKIVTDKDKGFNQIIQEMEKVGKSSVKIGFFAGQRTRQETKTNSTNGKIRKKEAGKSLVQIAIENEYGTQRIPARPFMTTTYDENRTKLNGIIGREYDKIIQGKSTVYKSLNALGLYYEGLVKQKIRSIRTPPNSPYTIAQKGSSKPLIDFGQMISAVTYEVRIR